jgi:putative ABC transport system permease protein
VFALVLRKLLANRWLTLCLLAGYLIGTALVSGIPMYTAGILQRMLTRDLERFQESNGVFTGRYSVYASYYYFTETDTNRGGFAAHDREVRTRLAREVGLPVLRETRRLTVDFLKALPAVQREEEPEDRYIKIDGLSDAADHLRIVHGRLFSPAAADGTVEVVVTEEAFKELDLLLDEVYTVTDLRDLLPEPLRVKVVGIFGMADPGDPWWFESLANYDISFLADFDLMRARWADTGSELLTGSWWSYAFDYHAITVGGLRTLVATLDRQVAEIEDGRLNYDLPMLETLRSYFARERVLTTTLWFLQFPVLLMLGFYIAMTSRLVVRHEANEIAILKSRGARSRQVFLAYLFEGLLLSAAALAVGPPAGYLLCRIIGAANGFLEFVQRAALPLRLGGRAYLAAAGTAALLTATMLAPAWLASRTTIVLHKQRLSRGARAPLWRRVFLDVALLAIAGYGWYGYRTQQKVLAVTGARAGDLPLDPLLFGISTLFIIGAGLLFLRLYPLAVELVFRAGRRVWPPGLYATFLGVSRGGGGEQFLMLFLVITLAIGVFDAKAARTINRSTEDRIRYATGADVTAREEWPTNRAPAMPTGPGVPAVDESTLPPLEYREPDFGRFARLDGVALATKVYRRPGAFVRSTRGNYDHAYVMGIVPDGFGVVAWSRPDLLPAHVNQYLNLLAASPKAMLVSEGLAKKHGLKPGDSISINWEDQRDLDGVVYGIMPYWPTWNPHETELVVANLAYLHAGLALEPYEVWMKLAPGATASTVYRALADRQIPLLAAESADAKIVTAKNDPLLQGTNGALTLGFTVTLLVAAIGFLIHWIISMQSRTLQFGVFRAMGLSRARVVGMIAGEQLLVSGAAIACGVAVGGVAGDLFVPLLQLTASAAEQVPPFHVTSDPADYVRLFAVAGTFLAAGLAVLTAIAFRIRIAQAIKLGEE